VLVSWLRACPTRHLMNAPQALLSSNNCQTIVNTIISYLQVNWVHQRVLVVLFKSTVLVSWCIGVLVQTRFPGPLTGKKASACNASSRKFVNILLDPQGTCQNLSPGGTQGMPCAHCGAIQPMYAGSRSDGCSAEMQVLPVQVVSVQCTV
jgi:hypothetical protein